MSKPGPAAAQDAALGDWPTQTRWSVVLAAGDPASPGAAAALEELCGAYWYPVYAYVRCCGHDAIQAQDLTQAFFLHLLASNALAVATPERGRFRTFLRACVDHFIVTRWRHETALKRGGGVSFLSWEQDRAEHRYQEDAVCPLTPEQLFERSWADTLLDRVLSELEGELVAEGKTNLFELLKDRLSGDSDVAPYAELAPCLGTTVPALKKTVHRLRQRYGELLRREIAHTVGSHEETEDELQHLLAVVSA